MTNTIELQLIVDDKGTATVKNFSQGSEKHISSLASTVSNKAGGAMRKFGSLAGATLKRVSSLVFSLKTAFIGLVVYGLNRAISGWEKLSATQELAEAGMVTAMKSMGRYTKGFEELIKQTAAAIQTQSTFGDEAILMGTKFLMTYGNISNQAMPRVMQAMTDLAALMKGDMTGAANMLGKASMGMTGELRKAGITVDTATFKSKGFIGVLEQIEAQIRDQAKAQRETKAGGLKAFGNVVSDVKEKFGQFTSTIKWNIATILLPHVEKLNKKLAEWIGTGQAERDAKRWADTIINAVKKVLGFIDKAKKPLSEFSKFFSDPGSSFKQFLDRWDDLGDKILKATRYIQDLDRWMKRLPPMSEIFGGGKPGKPSGAGGGFPLSDEMERAMQTARGRIGARSGNVLTDFGTPTPFASTESNKALEIGLQERLAMLTGHHDAAIAIQLAQNQLYAEMELERMEKTKAFSEERISLDQSEHDAALALMQSEQDAYFRMQEAKKYAQTQAVYAAVGLLEMLGQENEIAAQAALAVNTALSIAQAIQNTAVASTRALAELGPIAGPPAAASIQMWGAAQVALIAAQGVLKFASSFGKGGTGTPVPVSGGASATQIGAGVGGQSAQGGMTVYIYGDFYGDEAFIDRLAERLSSAVENRNVRIVSSEVM